MGKITFRADDDLVDELEAFDVSKSEVMRDALRSYLDRGASDAAERDRSGHDGGSADERSVDAALGDRIDEVVADRLEGRRRREPADVHVRITVDADGATGRGGTAHLGVNAGSGRSRGGDVERGRYVDASERAGAAQPERPDSPGRAGAPSAERTGAPSGERTGAESGGPRGGRTDACSQCGAPVNAAHVHCPNCGEKTAHRVFCECGDEVRSDWAFCPSCGRRTPAADVLDSR